MTSDVDTPTVFRPRTGTWFTAIAVLVAAGGLVGVVASDGPVGLLRGWPLFAVAFGGWWLFRYPAVIFEDRGVTLRNPLATVHVPWSALIDIDTKYALKLVTTSGSYTAWAAPAPGVWGTHAGKPEDLLDLPAISYGPGSSVRPGDLRSTDSGSAAYLARSRWQQLVESGGLDVDSPERAHRSWNWPCIAVAVLLVALGAAQAGVGS
jgi:hypothetical protein